MRSVATEKNVLDGFETHTSTVEVLGLNCPEWARDFGGTARCELDERAARRQRRLITS